MEEGYAVVDSPDASTRLRDMEEKQRLLKDRILLIGESLIRERDKNVKEIQEVKKTLMVIREEHIRMKEVLERVTEQLGDVARKEELMILQRQLDLLRQK